LVDVAEFLIFCHLYTTGANNLRPGGCGQGGEGVSYQSVTVRKINEYSCHRSVNSVFLMSPA
jgi:hypothetical protein